MRTIIEKKQVVKVNDFVVAKLIKDVLHLELEMHPPEPSHKGKMLMVASSHGWEPINIKYQGKTICASVNAGIMARPRFAYSPFDQPCAKVTGNRLILECKMQEPTPTAKGKGNIICQTENYIFTDINVADQNLKVSFVVYQSI
jgi:hypothetical protein